MDAVEIIQDVAIGLLGLATLGLTFAMHSVIKTLESAARTDRMQNERLALHTETLRYLTDTNTNTNHHHEGANQ